MAIPAKTRSNLLVCLVAPPRVLALIAAPFKSGHSVWDAKLPDRFTLREMTAHLADWDVVFRERIQAAIDEDGAMVDDPEAGERAEQGNYAQTDPHHSIRRYAEERTKLLALLRGLDDDQWQRTAHHPRHGLVSVETQAVHILSHDGYHLEYASLLLADAPKLVQ